MESIKEGFKKIVNESGITVAKTYVGNGTYLIKAEAKDYKMIEKYLTKINEELTKYFSKLGTIEIKRLDA